MKLTGLLIILVLCSYGKIEAQNPSIADSTINLRQVEVSQNRLSKISKLGTRSIDSSTISQYQDQSLAPLLSESSHVFIKSYGEGSLSTIAFRGTDASHSQVLWNEIPVNHPMLGQVDFSLIPAGFINEIDIEYGGNSLRSSSGGLGGVIHLSSNNFQKSKHSLSLSQSVGSFNTYSTMAEAGLKKKRLKLNLRYIHRESENDFSFINSATGLFEEDTQKNAAYSLDGILGNFQYNFNKNTIGINIWQQWTDRNIPYIMSYEGDSRTEYQIDKSTTIHAFWKSYGENLNTSFHTGMRYFDNSYYLAHETPLGTLVNYNTSSITESYFNKFKFNYSPGSSLKLSGNLFNNIHKVRSRNLSQTVYNNKRIETGLSLSSTYIINSRLSSSITVRQELYDKEFSPFMYHLVFYYEILNSEKLTASLSSSRNTHFPTLNDLYWVPGGNPELKPEKSHSFEAALLSEIKRENFNINQSLNLFASQINDWILWKPGDFRYWSAENIREVYSRGIEYSTDLTYSLDNSSYTIGLKYAFTRTTDRSIKDERKEAQLIYIPRHKGNVQAVARFYDWKLRYHLYLVSERKTRLETGVTNHKLPGYSLHDLTASRRFILGKYTLDISAHCRNIFNTSYQSVLWRAMPGRNYNLTIKLAI